MASRGARGAASASGAAGRVSSAVDGAAPAGAGLGGRRSLKMVLLTKIRIAGVMREEAELAEKYAEDLRQRLSQSLFPGEQGTGSGSGAMWLNRCAGTWTTMDARCDERDARTRTSEASGERRR